MALLFAVTTYAQQQAPQPLTLWYGYAVRPGKEEEFMNLVKTIGAPVRDKQVADGVALGWGMETPLLRNPEGHTHLIWVTVANWEGVQAIQSAMQAQFAKIAADDAKAADEARKKGQKPGPTTLERSRELYDTSRTRDWLTRDIVFGDGPTPPAGTLPWTRYNFAKVKPGMATAYRAAWEKYNKPVFDQMVKNGTLLAYGLANEALRTDDKWTHFVWYGAKDLAAFDKLADAFAADRARRSPEERDAINAQFAAATEPDATRNFLTRSLMFKVAGMK
jgi:hypothetical protein